MKGNYQHKEITMLWQVRNWILSLRIGYLYNPEDKERLVLFRGGQILYEIRLPMWLCWLSRALAYFIKKAVLKSEKGTADLRMTILTFCFAFVILIIVLAVINTAMSTDDIGREIEQEVEKRVEIACERLCELDYATGIDNVVQHQQCLSNCSQ